jgi:hypothetical protein
MPPREGRGTQKIPPLLEDEEQALAEAQRQRQEWLRQTNSLQWLGLQAEALLERGLDACVFYA